MEQSYEKSLKRLEEIVETLEAGELSLEKTLELFSEGTSLLNFCGKYLDSAEQKIVKLMDSGEKDAH